MLSRIRSFLTRKSRVVNLYPGKSFHSSDLELVISSSGVWYVPNPKGEPYRKITPDTVDLVIGAPGLPNMKKDLQLGDAVLYQLPSYGVVEVRVVDIGTPVKVLITEVSPRRGFAASYAGETGNVGFSQDETAKISEAFAKITEEMASRADVTPSQIMMLREKLAEIEEASTRLGRKDWIMFSAGTFTNVVVGAAFAPEAARALFLALNVNLSWVFQNALRLTGS